MMVCFRFLGVEKLGKFGEIETREAKGSNIPGVVRFPPGVT